MTELDLEQIKRDCAEPLEAVQRDQRVDDDLVDLADMIRDLGPTYSAHGELMRVAVRDRSENTITWHLIHVLEKLEKGAQ